MKTLLTISLSFIFVGDFVQGATIFTTELNSGDLFSRIEITEDAARFTVSGPTDFTGADVVVESLLGDLTLLLSFELTDVSLVTFPSPPFTVGGIDFPATPSRLIFEQEYAITELQVAQFAELNALALRFSGGNLAAPISLALSSVPEPGCLSMLMLTSVTVVFRRQRRTKQGAEILS